MSKTRILTGETTSTLFDFDAPDWNLLTAENVANSLGKQCRYNGNVGSFGAPEMGDGFYSVAQHAVLCAAMAYRMGHSPQVVRMALMHDDVEAVTGDITQPMKMQHPDLADWLNDLEASYAAFHGWTAPHHDYEFGAVKLIDRYLGVAEGFEFFGDDYGDTEAREAALRLGEPIAPWPSELASGTYLAARYIMTIEKPDMQALLCLVASVNAEVICPAVKKARDNPDRVFGQGDDFDDFDDRDEALGKFKGETDEEFLIRMAKWSFDD